MKNYTIWNETLNKAIKQNPSLMDQWVLIVSGCHQYAEGICGQNFYSSILFKAYDPDTLQVEGFEKKGDWRRAIDPSYARQLTKKKINGHKTPYGEVGAVYRIVICVRFRDAVKCYNDGKYWFNDLNYYFKNSTPNAIDARQHARKEEYVPAIPA